MCAIQPIAATGRATPKMAATPCDGAAERWTPGHGTHSHGIHAHGTQTHRTGTDGPHRRAARGATLPAGASLLLRIFTWLGERRERRQQRQALERLNEAMLKDIGLSAADVEREIEHLYWPRFR